MYRCSDSGNEHHCSIHDFKEIERLRYMGDVQAICDAVVNIVGIIATAIVAVAIAKKFYR